MTFSNYISAYRNSTTSSLYSCRLVSALEHNFCSSHKILPSQLSKMTTPSSFAQFSLLPIEIQTTIWRFAFCLNTTFTSQAYQAALLRYTSSDPAHCQPICNTKYPNSGRYNNYDSIYNGHKYYAAEKATSFWIYDENDKPLPALKPIPWARHPWDRYLHIDISKYGIGGAITWRSGIPSLLHTCRLARITAFETWRDVLVAWQLEEERIPWKYEFEYIELRLEAMKTGDYSRQ